MSRRRVLAAAVALAVLLAADLSRPPARQWTVAAAVGGIHLYQRTLSRWLSATGVECRFTPTCSRYAEGVLQRHGGWRGGWLTARRLARCGPWTPMGTNHPIDD